MSLRWRPFADNVGVIIVKNPSMTYAPSVQHPAVLVVFKVNLKQQSTSLFRS